MKPDKCKTLEVITEHEKLPSGGTGDPHHKTLENLVDEVRNKILHECKIPLKPRTDAPFITKFLRVKKYNVDKAVKGIVYYYNHIHRNIRIVEGIKPSEYSEPYDAHAVTVLKNRSKGSQVIYAKVKNWNTKHFGIREIQCAGLFLLEELLKDDGNQLNGLIGVIDLSGLGFSHMRQMSPFEMKSCVQMFLEGMPARVAGLHAINFPTIFWPIFKLVMSLLPQKIKDRTFIHDNLPSLHKHIDPEILPISLGGHLDETEASDEHLITSLVKANPIYDSYWNGDLSFRPRRLSRKRSSLMIN